jgi:hypothetical protein
MGRVPGYQLLLVRVATQSAKRWTHDVGHCIPFLLISSHLRSHSKLSCGSVLTFGLQNSDDRGPLFELFRPKALALKFFSRAFHEAGRKPLLGRTPSKHDAFEVFGFVEFRQQLVCPFVAEQPKFSSKEEDEVAALRGINHPSMG